MHRGCCEPGGVDIHVHGEPVPGGGQDVESLDLVPDAGAAEGPRLPEVQCRGGIYKVETAGELLMIGMDSPCKTFRDLKEKHDECKLKNSTKFKFFKISQNVVTFSRNMPNKTRSVNKAKLLQIRFDKN